MNDLLKRIKTAGVIKEAEILSNSSLFNKKDMIPTQLPILNIAFSGDLDGGLVPGLTIFAGQSKSFKTLLGLYCLKAYFEKYPDSIGLIYDSEFGITPDYLSSMGINTNRILHVPIEHVEQLKFDVVKRLEEIKRNDKVFIMVDSLGNLASKKEVEDAIDGKSVADMSRAKAIRSLLRIITPHLTMKDLPCIVINHVYQTQCLAGNTLIKTIDGLIPISKIQIGDYVYALNGVQKVTNIFGPESLSKKDKQFLELTFDDGSIVKCTNNHRFLINNKQWVCAEDLKVGQIMY